MFDYRRIVEANFLLLPGVVGLSALLAEILSGAELVRRDVAGLLVAPAAADYPILIAEREEGLRVVVGKQKDRRLLSAAAVRFWRRLLARRRMALAEETLALAVASERIERDSYLCNAFLQAREYAYI